MGFLAGMLIRKAYSLPCLSTLVGAAGLKPSSSGVRQGKEYAFRISMPISLLLLLPSQAFGYAGFIGYGYSSCLTCHYNSHGNGQLTDYGRALSATTISGRLFIPEKVSDQDLGEASTFFFGAQPLKWARFALDFRGMLLSRNLLQTSSSLRVFPMQMDAGLVLKFGRRDWLVFSVSGGVVPITEVTAGGTSTSYLPGSREHWVAVQPWKFLRFLLGKADIVYGVRIPDHNAYARTRTGLAQNDQVHGAVAHLITPRFEAAIHGFVGDLFSRADNRQMGGSIWFEVEPFELGRLGASFLHSSNDYLRRTHSAAHARIGVTKGSSVLIEVGLTDRYVKAAPELTTLSAYAFVQGLGRVARGVHLMSTFELFRESITYSSPISLRFGPGLQLFPWQRVELRAELINQRTLDPTVAPTDSWDFQSQVHLSL